MRPCWEYFVQRSRAQDVDYTLFKSGEGGNNSDTKRIQENNDILGEKESKINKRIMAPYLCSVYNVLNEGFFLLVIIYF